MPLTHDFKETIRARAQRDPAFRQALLRESVECILNGELQTGKSVLRDYVNATVGFQTLEKRTQIPAKSLMRMLGPKGSPSVANFSSILTALAARAAANVSTFTVRFTGHGKYDETEYARLVEDNVRAAPTYSEMDGGMNEAFLEKYLVRVTLAKVMPYASYLPQLPPIPWVTNDGSLTSRWFGTSFSKPIACDLARSSFLSTVLEGDDGC